MHNRRDILRGASVALMASLAMAGFGTAFAADYPSRPVTMVVGYDAGGPSDLAARFVAQRLSEKWGQPVVVENRPGASGTLAGDYVARAEADGYTILMGNNAAQGTYELLNPTKAPYKTLEVFDTVALVGISPLVMIVANKVPANSLSEFIAWAKERPGEVNYASAAVGSATQMASSILSEAADLDMEMIVYSGGAPSLQSVVAGETDMYMGGYSTVSGQVEAGSVKMLAVAAEERISAAPDLPTFKEQGIDLLYGSWFGIVAPKGVPAEILDKINADVNEVLSTEEASKALKDYGFEKAIMSRDEFNKMLSERIASDARIVESAGISTE